MRRHVLALLVVTLASLVLSPSITAQDVSDAALARLREAVKTRPDDAAARQALVNALDTKRRALLDQAEALRGELAQLKGAASVPLAGCDATPPVRVGGAIEPPRRTHDVQPVIPSEVTDNRLAGTVVVEITIDCVGAVADARVLRGVPALNASAVNAIRQWRYNPTLLNGRPVPVIVTVTVSFTPE